jgi:DNA helicase-2/ATP-dependent DNA helicase PcrA
MVNETEQEEREYLEVIKERLVLAIKRADESVKEFSKELQTKKEYIYEHQSGMDEADMVAAGQSINRMVYTGESAVARKRKLLKLLGSPYFARIDFATHSENVKAFYIGIHSFADETMRGGVIYDWRAPVSSMFYDFELGDAWYETPNGKVPGTIALKRQYRIREGKMEFMIENSLNIQDDILQKELSKSSDDRMKNIVATIQRDQNAVIRDEDEAVMIIQGVAGSGKTSIALHRVAFLLYKFRDTIKSNDILIISPNKVFADYISSVLPELGEEHIPEMGMDELAAELLGNQISFQSFFKQVNHLLDQNDEAFVERIRFKSSFQFLSKLNQYFIHITNNFFEQREIRVAGIVVPGPLILEKFKSYHRMPLLKRIPEVVKDILQHVRATAQKKISGHDKTRIWEEIPRMFRITNVQDIYRDFFKWIGREDLLRMPNGAPMEYADVFPLIYCKIRLEGASVYDHVKHLVIDEMQDYTPVQYAVISRIFHCRKTILGDVSQTVNPYSASSAETIEEVFPQGKVVRLFRSYRSTYEITNFAQRIRTNPQLIAMERHGEEPKVLSFNGHAEEIEGVRALVETSKRSGHQSLGIVCKTHQQANSIFQALKSSRVHLLNADSTSFKEGVVITTAHIAKGLEFDEVIVPFVSASNYRNDVDRSMLYIACTRAMHKLTLTYAKDKSGFI